MPNQEQVIRHLKREQGTGSMRALAKKIGCSAPYLGDVLRGNRTPGPKILKFLGLEREQKAPTYREAK